MRGWWQGTNVLESPPEQSQAGINNPGMESGSPEATQGLDPGLSHCWQILYQMNYQGSPSGSYLGRLEVLAMEIRQEKDWKIKKKEKMVLFTDKKIAFIEKESLLLKFWWVFSKTAEYNINAQK